MGTPAGCEVVHKALRALAEEMQRKARTWELHEEEGAGSTETQKGLPRVDEEPEKEDE